MVDQRPSGWIGTVLQDKWRIESRIARGGVATVFRATHRRGQVAAIKIMHPEFSRNADVRSRFLREGYAANKVGHPGVVRIIDDDVTSDGSAYIVMELLEHGEQLEEKRERNGGRLSVQEVARICDQVLDVLGAAHDQGIIHRDIKPENIFVLADGTVKVLDFGIAHIKEAIQTGEPTATGLLLGTPEFMAPEQALGKRGQIDAHTDVYAIGATMFTLLSGEAVHVHETLSNLLMAASTRQARSLASTKVGREIPREVIAVVDKALALEKHRRWPSARAMRDALRKAVPQDYPSTPALTPLARPSAFPPPPTATPRGGTKAASAPPPPAPSSPAPPPAPKPISLKPPPMQKLQRIPLPSAPPPAMGAMTPRSGTKGSSIPATTPGSGVKLPLKSSIPATTPGSGVKLPAPKLPATTPASGVKAPPPRASRPPPVIEPAPDSSRTRTEVDELPGSAVPSSEPTAERELEAPPPSGPTAVIEPPPLSGSERTVVRPPRDDAAPRDPWTTDFTQGDMEGPTVATTETPAALSTRAFAPPPADEEATRAQAGPPVRRPDAGERRPALAAEPEPLPDEEEAKRTMRLDRPRSDGAFDPTPPAPFTPVKPPGSGARSAFGAGPMGAASSARSAPESEGIARLGPAGVQPSPPLHTPAHLRAATREQPTPAPRGQPGWLPHQEPPRVPQAEPEKPRAIRIAEIALAALVVITLSIGGCLLMQNR